MRHWRRYSKKKVVATGNEIRLGRLGFEGADGAGGVASEARVLRMKILKTDLCYGP
jgi:hypothetical protein